LAVGWFHIQECSVEAKRDGIRMNTHRALARRLRVTFSENPSMLFRIVR
jgi:hypothetical protein